MKYYVTSDLHGFLTPFTSALRNAGYYDDPGEKMIIICGDIMDGGIEEIKTQNYILDLMKQNSVILIRGNHDTMFRKMVAKDKCIPYLSYICNGTFQTALALTGYDFFAANDKNEEFVEAVQKTPFYSKIIPAMIDYYETEHYVFVHGWIPAYCQRDNIYAPKEDWRESSPEMWEDARWYNGMDAANQGVIVEGKTIVCGHWHCSYGHSNYEGKGSEFGEDADFSPYYGPGIIALDACIARSGQVNVIVLEDDALGENG